MILDVDCQNIMLNNFMYIVKNIMNIILIAAPILLILSLTITLSKMAMDPDEKKNPKKIWNAIKALVIIFFIPLSVSIVMRLLGNDTEISSCYNNAKKPSAMVKYIEDEKEKEKKKITHDPDDFEKGVAKQLEFDCTSSIVKSKFSCETLKIVEQHLNDFTESNFKSTIASVGGFDNYAKSLGGVFTEFYGAKPKVTTAYELQRVSEYVYGFLYMYGFDYKNGTKNHNKYCKWGGDCSSLGDFRSGIRKSFKGGSSDAFLPGKQIHDSDGLSDRKHFDTLISDKDEINMTTNCNWTVDMVFYKAGIFGTGRTNVNSSSDFKKMARKNKIITNFKDFRPGDLIHFFNQRVDSSNPSTWKGWKHVAFVGEVDLEKHTATIYEGGSYFIRGRNFKRVINTDKTTKNLAGYQGWGAVRVIELS